MFLFELIRTQKIEKGKKKSFLTETLGKAEGVEWGWNVDVEHRGRAFPSNAALHRAAFSGPRKASPLGAQLWLPPGSRFLVVKSFFLLGWDWRGALGGVKKGRELSFKKWEIDWLRGAASGR